MLDAKRLGLAGGILWGIPLFILTIFCLYTGYGEPWLMPWESVYPGYGISWVGAFFGLLCGFVDGFVGFYLLAWIYNKLK